MAPSFQELKAQLDPCCTYVVFEKHAAIPALLEFAEVNELLRTHEDAVVTREVHHDGAACRLFLIVKLDPLGAQRVQDALLQARLPKDIVMYLFAKESNHSDRS